ncbi:hypothetical protein BH11PLA2_BH11PLA2_38440 [soil metagenome]
MARLLKVLRLLLGHGRWGPDNLACEVECSKRTILRDLEVLSVSGIPVYFDRQSDAYRIQDGFKFPGMELGNPRETGAILQKVTVMEINKLIEHLEATLQQLHALRNKLAQ